MNRIIEYKIANQYEGQTIGAFFNQMGFSHPIVVNLKRTTEGILVNGSWERVTYQLKKNDILRLFIEEATSSEAIHPVPFPLDIIYEDQDIILVNKPANMPIHPSLNNYENTLANALTSYYEKEDSPFVFRCLNRLDRDTTGLTIIAKNPLSAAVLSRDMKNRKIRRTYYALVEGCPPENGTVDAPIGRTSDSLITREVNFQTGQQAVTHYERLTSVNNYSLLKINLETGRTHQIRVHMKYIGHPLPGDFIYNPNFSMIERQALHAGELDFLHPITKQALHFIAPLPDDMQCLTDYHISITT